MRLFKLMTSLLNKTLIIWALTWAPFFFDARSQDKAPQFSLVNHEGIQVSLSDFKNKIVILEWFNKGCPFVKKFYESSNMQAWQKELTKKDIIWLTISSSVKGKQGYETIEQVKQTRNKWNINSTMNLLDHSGDVGRKYGAKTTPHIFILNKEHNIVYNGAIDDIVGIDPEEITKAKNYLLKAARALLKNEEIKIERTKPYGCSVKY